MQEAAAPTTAATTTTTSSTFQTIAAAAKSVSPPPTLKATSPPPPPPAPDSPLPAAESDLTEAKKVGKNNNTKNFEEDDAELEEEENWPAVDVGNLIIDLDADIDKASGRVNVAAAAAAAAVAAAKSGGTTTSLPAAMSSSPATPKPPSVAASTDSPSSSDKMTVGGSQTVTETQAKDSSASGAAASSEPDKGLKMKIKRTNKGTPKNPDGKMEIVSETQQQDSASAANGLGTDLSSGSNPGSPSSTASVEPTGKKSPLLVTKRPAEKSGLAAKERMKMNSSAAKVNSNGSKSGGKSHTNGGGAIVPVTKSFTTPPSAAGGSATASTTTTVNNVNGDSVVNPAMSNRMNSHNSSYNKTREAEEAPTAKRQKVRPNCKENLSVIDQQRIMLSRVRVRVCGRSLLSPLSTLVVVACTQFPHAKKRKEGESSHVVVVPSLSVLLFFYSRPSSRRVVPSIVQHYP